MSENKSYYEIFIHLISFVLVISLVVLPNTIFYSCANLIGCFFVLSCYCCLCFIHCNQNREWRSLFYISLVWLVNLILQGYNTYSLFIFYLQFLASALPNSQCCSLFAVWIIPAFFCASFTHSCTKRFSSCLSLFGHFAYASFAFSLTFCFNTSMNAEFSCIRRFQSAFRMIFLFIKSISKGSCCRLIYNSFHFKACDCSGIFCSFSLKRNQ